MVRPLSEVVSQKPKNHNANSELERSSRENCKRFPRILIPARLLRLRLLFVCERAHHLVQDEERDIIDEFRFIAVLAVRKFTNHVFMVSISINGQPMNTKVFPETDALVHLSRSVKHLVLRVKCHNPRLSYTSRKSHVNVCNAS